MKKAVAVFGMNSMFAVRQFLPEILAAVQQRGLNVVVIAPAPAAPGVEDLSDLPDVRFRFVSLERESARSRTWPPCCRSGASCDPYALP